MIDEPVGYVCPLAPRELEVLTLLAEGNTAKQIARMLNLAPHTINFYTNNAKRRLGPRTLPGLVAYVMRKGWIN